MIEGILEFGGIIIAVALSPTSYAFLLLIVLLLIYGGTGQAD
jgi:hypothetical protein